MSAIAPRSPLRVKIVSDVVCPWCLIGTRRLELALEAAGAADADVEFRPFLLDPSTPPEGEDLRGRLRRKYGNPDAMFARVEAAARQSGIDLDFSRVRRAVSTLRAHTLLRHARPRGTQVALAKALFGAYFLDGQDVSDPALLAPLASRHGFDEAEAARLMGDQAELERTRREADEAARAGVSGVPFTVFGGRYAVAGAQPIEVFRQAIERALAEAAGLERAGAAWRTLYRARFARGRGRAGRRWPLASAQPAQGPPPRDSASRASTRSADQASGLARPSASQASGIETGAPGLARVE